MDCAKLKQSLLISACRRCGHTSTGTEVHVVLHALKDSEENGVCDTFLMKDPKTQSDLNQSLTGFNMAVPVSGATVRNLASFWERRRSHPSIHSSTFKVFTGCVWTNNFKTKVNLSKEGLLELMK